MAAICKRLLAFGEFELQIFGDEVILEQPIEQWPQCDALLSWHSDGFPLKKVPPVTRGPHAHCRPLYTYIDTTGVDLLSCACER
jgi:hypothetical protein